MEVTAVTASDDFLLEIGELLGGQAPVHPRESLGEALEQLANTRHGQLLLLDARASRDARADVEHAREQAPHALIVLFAGADADVTVSPAVKSPNVFALLPLPLDARKTAAVLEGAMGEAVARRPQAVQPPPPAPALTFETFAPPAAPDLPRRESTPVATGKGAAAPLAPRIAAGVTALIALGAGAWWFTGRQPATAPRTASAASARPSAATAAASAPAAESAVETRLVTGKVDELLEKARLAMRERHYTDPGGDNALLYYRSVVAEDKTNGEALEGLQRIAGVLTARFDDALAGARLDEAALALANFRLASPHDAHAPALEQRLLTGQFSHAMQEENFERAAALLRQAQQGGALPADQLARWRTELARHQDDMRLQRLGAQVAERLREGRLIDTADGAKSYAKQMRELAPASPATQRAQRDLNAAYLRRARDATLARNPADADRWLEEARAGGVSAAELAAFQRDLAGLRQKAAGAEAERLVQLARDRLGDGRLTEPTQDSAAFYLAQAQAADASNAALGPLAHDLGTRLADRARRALAAGNQAQFDSDAALARRLGVDTRDLQAAQSTANQRTAAGSGGGSSPAVDPAQLKRTRYVAPEYPARALAQGISGQVTVEFTIDRSGTPRDLRIASSNPPKTFDSAALEAVRRWRYQPWIVNGEPAEVPVRMSVRFELPKK